MWQAIVGFATGAVLAGLIVSRLNFRRNRRHHAQQWALRERTRHAEKLAEMGVLTGHLMHELRNPLSTVKLNLQLLGEDIRDLARSVQQESGPESELAQRFRRQTRKIDILAQETVRLSDTLTDFLRYAGKMELHRTQNNINELVDDLVDFYEPQAEHHGIKVRRNLAAKQAMGMVDASLIKQAVLNLMINAVQVMPPGGELMVNTKAADGGLRIDVIDTGPGIPPEQQEKIFEAYFTTRPGGTGLGLAIGRRIVEEHGGYMELHSEVGKGSCFSIFLPLIKEGSQPETITP